MIKFVHQKYSEEEKGSSKIVITYSFIEVILGFVLLFTNIFATFLIFKYVIYPQTQNENPCSIEVSSNMTNTKI